MRKKLKWISLLILLSSIALSACAGGIPSDIPQDELERIVEQTLQALPTPTSPTSPPVPTATSVATITVTNSPLPPTATAPPRRTFSLPGAERVVFAPGATFATVRGRIGPGQTENYVLGALEGQPMQASVASANNDVTMSIVSASGTALLPASQDWTNWQGTLPASQDYYIQIIGGGSDQDYSLAISIPSRIEFEPGATSATVTGQTVDGNIASYAVAAQGGQTMDIVLSPEPNVAALTVWGFSDGQPYMRAQMGSTTFNMQLPSTQDYIINIVPQGGQEVDFTLKVEIR
jgi:hypothetical protein